MKRTKAQQRRLGELNTAARKANAAFYRMAQEFRAASGSCIGEVPLKDRDKFDELLKKAETATAELHGAWYVLGALKQ